MGGGVSLDKYFPRRIATNRTVASWSGAHSCGDAHHNCTFVRFCARAREDVQARVRTPSRAYQRLALLGGFNNLVPLSLGEAPLARHHEGIPSMLLPINLELTRVHHPAICTCPRKSSHNRRDG